MSYRIFRGFDIRGDRYLNQGVWQVQPITWCSFLHSSSADQLSIREHFIHMFSGAFLIPANDISETSVQHMAHHNDIKHSSIAISAQSIDSQLMCLSLYTT